MGSLSGTPAIDELIHELRQRDVRLRLDQGELSVDAPKGTLQQEDVQRLRAHKQEILEFLREVASQFEPPALQPWPRPDRIPLSFAQQRLWIVDQLSSPHGGARAMRYHLPQVCRLRGPLDADVLHRVLDELVRRHEVLRTRIVTVEGMPVQAIAEDERFALQRIDLSLCVDAQREQELQGLLLQLMQQAFDLTVDAPIRGCLLRMGEDDHVLFIAMHHIAADGWSQQILWREICALYDGFQRGELAPLPAVEIQYADYAQWERSWLQGGVLEGLLGYWKRQLSGVTALELPRDHELPPVPSFKGATHAFVIERELVAGLRALTSQASCSLFMTMFAVFHVLLSRLSGQRDFAVLTPVAGRGHRGTEALVGLCVNSLVLRVTAEPDLSFRALLGKTRRVVLDAYKHQDLPFEQLIAWIRADGEAALGGVSFTMNSIARGHQQPDGLQMEPVLLPWTTTKSELTLGVHETSDDLYCVFEYSCDSFDARTIEAFERRFLLAARQIVSDPDIALDAIDLSLEGDTSDARYRYSARFLKDRVFWCSGFGDAEPISLSAGATRATEANCLQAARDLDAEAVKGLIRNAATCDATLPQLLLAVVALYLHKVGSVQSACFGLITEDGSDVLPFERDIDARESVRDFVKRTADRSAQLLDHSGLGSDRIRELRGLDDEWRCRTVVGVGQGGLDLARSITNGATALHVADLRLLLEIDGGVRIRLQADARWFESWELYAHLDAMFGLLARAATPGFECTAVATLSLLDGEGLTAMLGRSRGPRVRPPRTGLVHELFEAQVKRRPEAAAVIQGAACVSYGELDAQANRLAHHLRALDVGPGALVVVFLERGIELISSLLAVLKCGAAYVPVDPATAAERLHYVVDDSCAAAIVTHSSLEHLLPATGARVIALDTHKEAIAQRPAAKRPRTPRQAASAPAYVIYTSGSTGEPKGVVVEHGNLLNHACWMLREFEISPVDRALQFASISFDASAEEIYPTLLAGATLVMRPPSVPSAQELMQSIVTQDVTLLNLPTAYWHAFVDALSGARIGTGRLRLIVVGGERVGLDSLLRWRALAGETVELVNTYGPTEATITSTSYRLPRDCSALTDVPIGRPIDNACTYVLDAAGQPVPVGVIGELHLGGAGVAAGYWRRDALSAARFIADPFVGGDARMYRSGDLVRWLPDDQLAYVGRNDDQLKLRGFRIEPGEIETQLRACPQVREAAVLLREDVMGDKRLVAYVGSSEPPALLAPVLRARLQKVLPEYMVPGAIVVLDALPLTLNGKLDRRALPAPVAEEGRTQAYEEPKGEVEQALAQIWREVLHVERVGRHDNFFDLGGSSISAIQLIGRANQAGIKVNLNSIFEERTVANLAAQLERSGTSSVPLAATRQRAALQAPERGSIAGPVPFTPIQIGVLQQGEEAVRYLTATRVLSCRRRLSAELLDAALRKLVYYHDALRLCITRDEAGEWAQAIAPVSRMAEGNLLECISVDSKDGIAALLNTALQDAAGRIDSRTGALLQATLVSVGQDASEGQALLLAVHHFAIDPISWEILVQDLQTVYEQLEDGLPARLPIKSASFQQWSHNLHAHAQGPSAALDLDYWRAAKWECRPGLPAGREADDDEALCVTVGLDASLTRALLTEVPRVRGAQVNEMLLATMAQALHRWCGHAQFALGMYHHGRAAAFGNLDLSRTLGWFTAPIPLLLSVTPGAPIDATLQNVKAELRAMPNEGLGYGILRHLHPDAEALPVAEIDVLLNHQGTVAGESPGGLFTAHFDEDEYTQVLSKFKFPWKVAVLSNIADGCLRANLVSCRYSRPALQAIADAFEGALRELCQVTSDSLRPASGDCAGLVSLTE